MTGTLLWSVLALLAVLGWLRVRARLRAKREREKPEVDDRALRRILEEGRLETDEDEPLDPEEAAEEERRFWEESWDEPEAW